MGLSALGSSARTQLAFGGDHGVYLSQCSCRLTDSPTRRDLFDKIAKARLDREVYSNRVPCGDLFDHRVTEVITNPLNVRLFGECPRRRLSLVPSGRNCAGGRADEGIQVFDHTHHFRL